MEFQTPFQIKLDKGNRWVKLAALIPWDELATIYYKAMSTDKGAPGIDARVVIGAMILKHKLKIDDREVIEYIRENVYVQYFLGLSNYTYEDVFDRSLFTTIRYRLGEGQFDQMNQIIIEKAAQSEDAGNGKVNKKETSSDESLQTAQRNGDRDTPIKPNKGRLQMDATVADQMILYPTDLGLLSTGREEGERLIDVLCKRYKIKDKPRTYRRKARQAYLLIAKKKQKTKKEIRKGIGRQLRFLKRDIQIIHQILDKHAQGEMPFKKRDRNIFYVIQHLYDQQKEMYDNHTHSVEDRIVNIYQPYVRPIVRGKEKANVEFGSKLGVSLQNGFARINTFSWDAYNENTDLIKQVEDYRKLNHCYPKVVIADNIYGTRTNREWMKERGIRFSGKALGRPSKEDLTPYQKIRRRKENAERNQIEGKFGQGKNGYLLNKIRARAQRTSESWVACIFFVMNLIKFEKIMAIKSHYFFIQFFQRLKKLMWSLKLFFNYYIDIKMA